jgi:hypothetical protein
MSQNAARVIDLGEFRRRRERARESMPPSVLPAAASMWMAYWVWVPVYFGGM